MATKETKKAKPAAAALSKKTGYHGKHVIIRPYISEKSQRLFSDNQYSFLVTPDANKVLVREEVERTHGVHVKAVTITKIKMKTKRYRGKPTSFKPKKKATVKLAPGDKLDIA